MKWFGLTGGIASGKSTVAQMMAEMGVHVIDADVVAREVVEPGEPALEKVVDAFGQDILTMDGKLDRAALGEIVFGDEEARETLNGIVHPAVAMRTQQYLQSAREEGLQFVVYDAALIVENSLHQAMDGLSVVSCPEQVQVERLRQRDGISEDAAKARIESQLPLAEKVAVATWVIDNGGTLEQTRQQVEHVVGEMRARASDE